MVLLGGSLSNNGLQPRARGEILSAPRLKPHVNQTIDMREPVEKSVRHLIAEIQGSNQEDVLCALRTIGAEAVQPLADAYACESEAWVRALLVRALWEIRDLRAVPALTAALRDEDASVWKEALDGLVTLGGDAAVSALERTRVDVESLRDCAVRREWIDEALEQLREGDAG